MGVSTTASGLYTEPEQPSVALLHFQGTAWHLQCITDTHHHWGDVACQTNESLRLNCLGGVGRPAICLQVPTQSVPEFLYCTVQSTIGGVVSLSVCAIAYACEIKADTNHNPPPRVCFDVFQSIFCIMSIKRGQ